MPKQKHEPVDYADLKLPTDLSRVPPLVRFESMDEWRTFQAKYRQTLSLKKTKWAFDERMLLFTHEA